MEDVLKALADESRLRLFHLLSKGEFCVCEIEVLLNMSQSNASRHLSKLRSNGIIASEKDGLWVHYRISEHFKSKYIGLMADVLRELAQGAIYLDDAARLEKYRAHGLNCQVITSNRDYVIETINLKKFDEID